MARFPVEICDMFIDNLVTTPYDVEAPNSNVADFGNCALVQRSWIHRSRRHLFRSVFLDKRQRAMSFVDLVASPLSTFAPHVRTLHLDFSNRLWDGHDDEEPRLWVNDVLPHVTGFALQRLELTAVSSDELSDPSRHALLTLCQNLDSLQLCDVGFSSFPEVVEIVCASPVLSHLSLSQVSWEDASLPTSVPEAHLSSRLSTLLVDQWEQRVFYQESLADLSDVRTDKDTLLRWLLSKRDLPPIHTLGLLEIDVMETGIVGAFLKQLGSSIKDLRLGGASDDPGSDGSFRHAIIFVGIL
jgi:hypothetical protein